jgi:hypothetical protein
MRSPTFTHAQNKHQLTSSIFIVFMLRSSIICSLRRNRYSELTSRVVHSKGYISAWPMLFASSNPLTIRIIMIAPDIRHVAIFNQSVLRNLLKGWDLSCVLINKGLGNTAERCTSKIKHLHTCRTGEATAVAIIEGPIVTLNRCI